MSSLVQFYVEVELGKAHSRDTRALALDQGQCRYSDDKTQPCKGQQSVKIML